MNMPAYIGNKLMDVSVPGAYSLSQSTINRHDLRKFYQHECKQIMIILAHDMKWNDGPAQVMRSNKHE